MPIRKDFPDYVEFAMVIEQYVNELLPKVQESKAPQPDRRVRSIPLPSPSNCVNLYNQLKSGRDWAGLAYLWEYDIPTNLANQAAFLIRLHNYTRELQKRSFKKKLGNILAKFTYPKTKFMVSESSTGVQALEDFLAPKPTNINHSQYAQLLKSVGAAERLRTYPEFSNLSFATLLDMIMFMGYLKAGGILQRRKIFTMFCLIVTQQHFEAVTRYAWVHQPDRIIKLPQPTYAKKGTYK